MKKVTVITITYNSSQYVKYAIESVLSQSFTDFEYIIGDDCSTDNTWDIINQYNDKRIIKYRNEVNIGEYPNRNKSLDKASGDYVIWIDGDDILYPHGLEFMVKMLDAFPDSAMASARPSWENMVYPYEVSPKQVAKFDFLYSPVTVNGFSDTLFKTEILKEEGGFSEKYISGDTYIKRYIALKYNTLLVSQSVSWWRKSLNQASKKLETFDGLVETYIMTEEHLNFAKQYLNEEEFNFAKRRLKNNFIKKGFRFSIKEKCFIKYFKSILKNQIGLVDLFKIIVSNKESEIEKSIRKDFFVMPISKNPFSINYDIK